MEIPTTLLVIVLMVLSNWGKVCSTKQAYIVHVNNTHKVMSSFEEHVELCTSSLASVSTSDQMLYTYRHAIPGYSATLTKHEARSLRAREDILSVRPQTTYRLHTTRTPHFLGLDHLVQAHHHLLPKAATQQLVIIGVLDTGVWPESRSFDDTGYGPITETNWNGTCEANIRCNNKLVGARSFFKGHEAALALRLNRRKNVNETISPLDFKGHGTHVMSTAGGSAVPNASLFGYANGTARGMAPYARLASYKVCWALACRGVDVLAGIDQAIEDGVHVLSLSIGSGQPIGRKAPYYHNDPIAQGAFTATQKGIFVSCSAGNSGPTPSAMVNMAPWITTVGAGTLDRDFPAYVILGNGKRYRGVSLSSGNYSHQQLPIVYAGNVSTNGSSLCLEGTLEAKNVSGKIVLCDRAGKSPRVEKGIVVKRAGGLGLVLANTAENEEGLAADAHLLPATAVTEKIGNKIKKYISSAGNGATATITFGKTKVGVRPSPVVAAFSSRGPNPETPQILKPDLIAPGVNILAAWPDTVGPSGSDDTDDRRVEFNIASGTSMACPHVSGLAALLKAVHPDWSPGAIRSALMTTAYSTYKNHFKNNGTILLDEATGEAATPFDYGAGHVDPRAALDPGLVYNVSAEDYLNFLCAINYTSKQIQHIARKKESVVECDKDKKYSVNDLNYPSFAVTVTADQTKGGTVHVNHTRTLTNVGQPGSTTYKVKLYSPSHSIRISVTPGRLTFNAPNDMKLYTVTFAVPTNIPANTSQFGTIEWSDGKHTVGSPVAFSWT